MPFTNIIEGKAVKPYLSKATAPWWEWKGGNPYHNKASSVDGPLFAGGGIVFVVKKAYARSSLEAKSLIAQKGE